MRSLFKPSKIVGLDIGSHAIKAVALSSGMKGVRVEGMAHIPFNAKGAGRSGQSMAESLRELETSGLFPAEWIAAALTCGQVTVRAFDLPRFPKQEGDSLVKYEMESLLPYQAENFIVDFLKRPSGEDEKTHILGIAAQKDDIQELMEGFSDAGIEPRSLGWSGLGAYLAFCESPTFSDQGMTLLLDMGAERTSIVIFDLEGPLLARSVEFGGDGLTEALAEELGISLGQAEAVKLQEGLAGEENAGTVLRDALKKLLREIEVTRLSLNVDFDRVVITGGTSRLQGATRFFREALGVECERFDILQSLRGQSSFAEEQGGPEYSAAAGLALAALNSSKSALNFLQEEFATKHPLDVARGKLRAAAILAIVAALLFGVNFYLDLKFKEERYNILDRQVREVFTATFPNVRNIVNEESQMNAAIEEAKKGVVSLAASGAGGMALDMLKSISLNTPPESNIRVTELSVGEREIMITGEAPSFESVNQFRDRLDDLQDLDQVTVEGANANEFNKRIDFSIKMLRRNP